MSGQRLLFTFLFSFCVFAVGIGRASAQEQVVVERDAELLAEPRSGAPTVARLKQGTTGEVIARKIPWVNLRTGSGTGWVQSFNLRFLAPGTAPAAGGKVPVPVVRTPTSRTTATIGIRGLDAEDMRGARFDAAQMRLLDQYAASRQDAEKTARENGLTATRVEYFK
jgi:hypothetical protein